MLQDIPDEIDPLSVFTPDDYKRWNLNIQTDRVAQLWTGKTEDYESWKELMVDLCASHWYGWRGILEHLTTINVPLRTATIYSTNNRFGLTGPQHMVLSSVLWSHLGRRMESRQRQARRRLAGENLNGYELWRRVFRDHCNGEEH